MMKRLRFVLLRWATQLLKGDHTVQSIMDDLTKAPDLFVVVMAAGEATKGFGDDENDTLPAVVAVYLYRRVVISALKRVLLIAIVLNLLAALAVALYLI